MRCRRQTRWIDPYRHEPRRVRANRPVLAPAAEDELVKLVPYRYAAVAATDFIRVRAWEKNPTVRFLVFAMDSWPSGPCEVVR
jgi:hypothetical protein